jgi:branched-chain amino acid transport system ATP-binding protein
MLELERINCHYAKVHVLHDVSIRVDAGEIVSMIGPNAAGKTTTLRAMAGLKPLSSGRIRYLGEDITGLRPFERVRRGLVLVPEGRQIFPKFTVLDNLKMGAYERPDRDHLEGDLEAVYGLFPRLAERRAQRGGSLSGGEQQMLAIGRGLMGRPRCLLLDEPSLGLAPIIVSEIARIIRELSARGLTIMLVEQNAAMALELADRAYLLESGHVSLQGTVAELRQTDVVRKLYLGTAAG